MKLTESRTMQSKFLCEKGGPNSTWAGPCPFRNPCSNLVTRYAASGGSATTVDEGARQGQDGRCHDSASQWCQAPNGDEALGNGRDLNPSGRIRAGSFRIDVSRSVDSACGVCGDVACSQGLTSLTDESPTPFPRAEERPGASQGRTTNRGKTPDYKPKAKRTDYAGARRCHSRCGRSGMAASPE